MNDAEREPERLALTVVLAARLVLKVVLGVVDGVRLLLGSH